MTNTNLWDAAKELPICAGAEITGGFSVGFDTQIPEAQRDKLMEFVYWVEDNFAMPITLWVDFKCRKYLIDQAGKRSGYRFWWAPFRDYPNFDNPDDIPVIELAVDRPMEEILPAFIVAISRYFAWLSQGKCDDFVADTPFVDSIIQRYIQDHLC